MPLEGDSRVAKESTQRPVKEAPGAKAKSGFFTKLIIVILLAAMAWQWNSLQEKLDAAEQQRQQLAEQVAAKGAENDDLQQSIDQGGSLEEMLRIAREQLGLVAPNEKVFYDTSN